MEGGNRGDWSWELSCKPYLRPASHLYNRTILKNSGGFLLGHSPCFHNIFKTTGTRPEFTNSYIPPATPDIVKTIRQLAQTGVNTPIMTVILFTLVGMGLMLAHRRGNTTVTARHKK